MTFRLPKLCTECSTEYDYAVRRAAYTCSPECAYERSLWRQRKQRALAKAFRKINKPMSLADHGQLLKDRGTHWDDNEAYQKLRHYLDTLKT